MISEKIKNSTVIVCVIEEGKTHITKAIGTGTIVIYKNQVFCISCRHIFEINKLMPKESYAFMITLNAPVNGMSRLIIRSNRGEIVYHPEDSSMSSYDVSVTFIGLKYDFPKIPLLEIEPGFEFMPEMKIYFYGYPTYALKREYFFPSVNHKINGVYRTAKVLSNHNLILSDYSIPLADITVAECDDYTEESIIGASGSGVYNTDEKMLGLLCGASTIVHTKINIETVLANGINIIPLNRIFEAITNSYKI